MALMVKPLLAVLVLLLAASERCAVLGSADETGEELKWNSCRWCCSPDKLLAVTPEMSSQPTQRILILLRGISYSDEYRKGAYDFRRTTGNFFSHMVEPLREQGHTVEVGISTYHSSLLPEVRRIYQPVVSHVVSSDRLTIMVGKGSGRTTKLDLVLAGLEAVEDANSSDRWDAVVLTRFDLEMRQPITSYAIDYEKLNFLWKEKNPDYKTWEELPRVADALQVIPTKFLKSYVEAMRVMVQEALDHPGVAGITYNNGHRILMNIQGVDIQQDVQLLSTETCRSDFKKVNPFYREAVSDELLRLQPKAWVPRYGRGRRQRIAAAPQSHR